jgi:hypothetical protein
MLCTSCGVDIPPGAQVCPHCSTADRPTEAAVTAERPKPAAETPLSPAGSQSDPDTSAESTNKYKSSDGTYPRVGRYFCGLLGAVLGVPAMFLVALTLPVHALRMLASRANPGGGFMSESTGLGELMPLIIRVGAVFGMVAGYVIGDFILRGPLMLYACSRCKYEDARRCIPRVTCSVPLVMLAATAFGFLLIVVSALFPVVVWWMLTAPVLVVPLGLLSITGLLEWLLSSWRRCPQCGARAWSSGFTRGFGL